MRIIYCKLLIGLSAATLGFRDQAGAASPSTAAEAPAVAVVDAAQAASSNAMRTATTVRLTNRTLQSETAQTVAAAVPIQGASTNGQQSVRTVLPNQPPPATGMRGATRQTTRSPQAKDSMATCVRAGSGLVGWWQADGSANDSAGSNNGTLMNGASFDSGIVGVAFNLNGSDQCVQIPYSLALTNSSFTVETWINPQGQPDWQAFIFGQAYGRQLIVRQGEPGVNVAFVITDPDGNFYEVDSSGEILTGEWTHLAGTWDGTTMKLYINGALDQAGVPEIPAVGDSTCPFSIGGVYGSCGYYGQFFPGLIDELSLYDRPLFAGEVNAIYLAGSAGKCKTPPACVTCPETAVGWWAAEGDASDTLHSTDGALQNDANFAPGKTGQAFSFDGVSQAVEIPYAPALTSTAFSVEAWVSPSGQAGGQAFIFGQSYGRQLIVRAGNQGLGVAFVVASDPWTFYEVDSSGEIPIGEWTHLVGTWDGVSSLSLYVNGALDQQATLEAVPWDSGCAFHIGGVYDPSGDCAYVGQFFNGLIDEATLYSSALPADQIQAIYNAGIAGKCADRDNDGLPDWWEFNHFGGLSQLGTQDYDSDGTDNAIAFTYGLDPNHIQFNVSFPKGHVTNPVLAGSLHVTGGHPAKMAVLIDSEDFASAPWAAYPPNNLLTVSLPADGNHGIWVGLKGRADDSLATWHCERVILESTPPALAFDTTGPGAPPSAVSTPTVLLRGSSSASLSKVRYDVGPLLSQVGAVLCGAYDLQTGDLGPSAFECLKVPLQPGANTITVRGWDLAGNQSSVSRTITYTPQEAPRTLSITWPPDNAQISGGTFMICGNVADPSVSVVVTADGEEAMPAYVEPGTPACFIVKDIPLRTGTKTYTAKATYPGGSTLQAPVSVTQSPVSIGCNFNPIQKFDVSVWMDIPATAVSVNGQPAALRDPDDGYWHATDIVPSLGCSPPVVVCATFAETPSPVYLAANPVFPPICYWTNFSHLYKEWEYLNRQLTQAGTNTAQWKIDLGGSHQWWNWYSDGWTFGGGTWYDVVYDGGTFDKYDNMVSWEYGGVDPNAEAALWDLRNRMQAHGLRKLLRQSWAYYWAWDFANVDPQISWYDNGQVRDRKNSYRDGIEHELFTGGTRGEASSTVLWFTMSARETFYGLLMEDPLTIPIPAEQCRLFGDPMHLEPYDPNNPNDPKRFTGHLIRNFPTFHSENPAPAVADCNWYTLFLGVTRVPLDIVGDANLDGHVRFDSSDEAWKDHHPYGVPIRNNDDDSDLDGTPDNQDEFINGWEDAVQLDPLKLHCIFPALPQPYSLRLRLADPTDAPPGTTPDQIVRIFSDCDPDTAVPILGPGKAEFVLPRAASDPGAHGISMENLASGDLTLYAEGIIPNAGVRVLYEIVLPDGYGNLTVVATDAVQLRVFDLDLEVDSDNNNGYGMPNDTPAEDMIEDNPGLPGKIIGVNDGDTDGDGIPGFADGFNLSGSPVGDDVYSRNDQFVALPLKLPPLRDRSSARLRLTYDSSDPWRVWKDVSPYGWTPGAGSLRIWKKPAKEARHAVNPGSPGGATWPGDYLAGMDRGPGGQEVGPGVTYTLSEFGFSEGSLEVTNYIEGVAPSGNLGDKEIKVELDPDGYCHWVRADAVLVTVVRANIDINRMNDASTVPKDLEHSNGGIVQIVPTNNPSALFPDYPDGIFLNIPTLAVEPASIASQLTLKLKKIWSTNGATHEPMSPGKIRVYRKRSGEANYSVLMDTDQTDSGPLDPALDLSPSASWRLDSTAGGVVDLALVAEKTEGAQAVEICRDTVRISSIPCQPAPGRIIFVNAAATSPAAPYDNFVRNAAQDVYSGVMQMQAGDNVLIAQGTYVENSIGVFHSGVIAGLGGAWSVADPAQSAGPLADNFDYSSLPIVDGSGAPPLLGSASIFTGGSTYSGLVLQNGTYNEMCPDKSGGAIYVSNLDSPVRIGFCDFQSNTAFDFGGAIYLSSASDVQINACKFETNKAEYITMGGAVCDRGMGGAIASIESSLTVSNSVFTENRALVAGSGEIAPPLGSAGGGGDIYVTNGVFRIFSSRSADAVAGFEKDATYNSPTIPAYLTGDGGSILVHGHKDSGATIEIRDCTFRNPIAYGNGGAISLSYDSSPGGRSYLDYDLPNIVRPTALSGKCVGAISSAVFSSYTGGWQGGAVSVNGAGMQLTFQECQFLDGVAGETAQADGKGGAVAICGGVIGPFGPDDLITVSHCTVLRCHATANGGGFYCTIRGNLVLTDGTLVQGCTAQKGGSVSAQLSGHGGGVHCSGGSFVVLSGAELSDNVAFGNGGGLSVKSATATLQETVSILRNKALGTNAETVWGNGGGIYITTGRHEPPREGAVAYVYLNDGTLVSTSSGVAVSQNQAARWGGGLYVGWPLELQYVGAAAKLENASVTLNTAGLAVNDSGVSRLPAQIATERVKDDVPVGEDGGYLFYADLRFNGTTITGGFPTSPDIGVYQLYSMGFNGTPTYTPGSLGKNLLIQYPYP
jgi:hypothetical protein